MGATRKTTPPAENACTILGLGISSSISSSLGLRPDCSEQAEQTGRLYANATMRIPVRDKEPLHVRVTAAESARLCHPGIHSTRFYHSRAEGDQVDLPA